MEAPFGLNPYENDPGAWGASLVNNAELLLACLDAAQARTVMEVGAYAGDLTRLLLLWADHAATGAGGGAQAPAGRAEEAKAAGVTDVPAGRATVTAIDPSPQPELEQLARQHPELALVRETSLVALEHVPLADAIVLDGDHNYYTVTEELARITRRAKEAGRALPLILLHDVCWPHGRRDDYYDPAQIPAEQRQPTNGSGHLYPGVTGTQYAGLPYRWPAAREGGPRNGVLSAAEDYVAADAGRRLAIVPAFFGLGVIWTGEAPYGERLEQILGPWDRNPLLERLERNRALHLASSLVHQRLAADAQARLDRIEPLLEKMLGSRAFGAAELFLRVRQRGNPIFSKQAIRDARR